MVFPGNSWGFLFLLYFYIQLSRCVVVGVLYPLLCRVGYGLDWKEATILVWSGLRGAVALSLSLSVKVIFKNIVNLVLLSLEFMHIFYTATLTQCLLIDSAIQRKFFYQHGDGNIGKFRK